jgi:hypothetical protein
MTDKQTGGPAFPIEVNSEMTCLGMTLRDYFAAKAIEGFNRNMVVYDWGEDVIEKSVTVAYRIADAMLKARNGH